MIGIWFLKWKLHGYICEKNIFLFIGSLADSICTAYENKMVKLDTKSHSSEKEIAPVTNLTSMLGSKANEFIIP